MARKSRKKYQLGSVIAIPLPDGRFGYAKAFNEPCWGVYDLVSDGILPSEAVVKHPFSFFQASTDEAVNDGSWPVIGAEAFASESDAWCPPRATMYVRETNEWTMGGIPRVNCQGETMIATLDDVIGMDIASVCHRPDLLVKLIIDRVVKGNHDQYRVRSS